MTTYLGSSLPLHDIPPVTGVLLTNLGTPEAPTRTSVRKYLAEFLSDRRVIETPRIIWWPLLHGIILNTRPKRSAAAYAKIWTNEGSPLLVHTLEQARLIRESLASGVKQPVIVETAMRYGEPSIRSGLEKLHQANAERILVFPLYPQYSATTTGSSFDAVTRVIQGWRRVPDLRFITHYHDDPGYISALVESIRNHWIEYGRPEKLLFSFHGLPRRYFTAGDPYYCECQKTARLVAAELDIEDDDWQVAFQSRFGPLEWLKPYTDEVLVDWAKSGIGNVQVLCPGFAADCLETLEEIQIQYRGLYLNAGGKKFSYIPALNSDSHHIDALTALITKHILGWETITRDQGLINERVQRLQD